MKKQLILSIALLISGQAYAGITELFTLASLTSAALINQAIGDQRQEQLIRQKIGWHTRNIQMFEEAYGQDSLWASQKIAGDRANIEQLHRRLAELQNPITSEERAATYGQELFYE